MRVAIGVVLVLVRVMGIIRVVFVRGVVVWLVPPRMRVMGGVVARGVHMDIHLGGADQMRQDLLAGALGDSMRLGQWHRTIHPEIQRGVEPAARPAPSACARIRAMMAGSTASMSRPSTSRPTSTRM